MNPSPRTQVTDERFYTPRAQVSTGRSTQSFETTRTSRSSEASSEYGTPRYWENLAPNTRPTASVPTQRHSCYQSDQQSYGSYDGNLQRGSQSHQMIPPQYPTKLSRVEYKDGGGFYSSDIDDVESQSTYRNVAKPYCYHSSYARHGRVEEVDNLLLRGVTVDVRDDNGNTILLISCQNGNKRLVKLALRYGADMNLGNFKGNTALHFCYRYGYAKSLGTYLKRKGADDSIRNLNGETCEDLGGTER